MQDGEARKMYLLNKKPGPHIHDHPLRIRQPPRHVQTPRQRHQDLLSPIFPSPLLPFPYRALLNTIRNTTYTVAEFRLCRTQRGIRGCEGLDVRGELGFEIAELGGRDGVEVN